MLRSFRVANHRSIRDEQELLLLPAYDKQHPVVPVAAIYGANASGKSNLLDALRFMQAAVRTSYGSWEPGSGVPRQPFRLGPSGKDLPSHYVLDLSLEGVRYSYGLAVDDDRVCEEWLYAYPHTRRRVIFERSEGAIRLGSTLPDHRSREAMLGSLTRNDALLLSAAAHANQAEVMPVYEWFRSGLNVVTSARLEPPDIQDRLDSRSVHRKSIVELIRVADLGIVDVQVVQPDELDVKALLDELGAASAHVTTLLGSPLTPDRAAEVSAAQARRERAWDALAQRLSESPLRFVQGKHGAALTYAEQSEGTQAWIALLSHALTSLESKSVLVIDEIDTSLHPRLTARLVELFQDPRTNPGAAQLVFATHDAALLGTSFGREILRRDQVWFVEKDAEGATALFPLTDFHPRKEENAERRYLGGSYGAVPGVFSDTLVEAYLAARPELLDDTA